MNNINQKNIALLQSIILMAVLYGWISLLFAILGIFYPIAIVMTWLALCGFLYYKKVINFHLPTRNFLTYILIALSFTLLIAYFTTPTIFSGRDQGSLSEAAMNLSENHNLIKYTREQVPFFEINEPGKALNFPGFFYTPYGGLLTQFPLPYIAFISGFFGLFGTAGFIIANSILLCIFILSITSVARYYMNNKYTLIFILLLLTSFSVGWFAKFTLSENIASMLLWSSLALYLILKKTQTSSTYFTFLLTISLLLFTRIEGVWFFIIFLFLAFRLKPVQTFLKKDIWWRVFFPITLLFVIVCSVLIVNLPFFITMFKASASAPSDIINPVNFLDKQIYLFSIYSIYGLLLPLLLTIIATVSAIFSKKYRPLLLPIIVVAPLFIYYLLPNISGDHPWMLRRFVFALLPATILVSTVFISYIKSSNIFTESFKFVLIGLLLIANLPSFLFFITYTENINLNEQISKISNNFNENDLLLVDKDAAGNGWSIITNPLNSLYQKHSVYFFNPNDFYNIETSRFDNVYLITSNKNESMYEEVLQSDMHYTSKYIITTNQLNISKEKIFPATFPAKEIVTTRGKIYKLTK